jgi:hypothetical protein
MLAYFNYPGMIETKQRMANTCPSISILLKIIPSGAGIRFAFAMILKFKQKWGLCQVIFNWTYPIGGDASNITG